LDVGAGEFPFAARERDRLVTVDFNARSNPTVVIDFTIEWPFGSDQFDFVYASHVIEHIYPHLRDRLVVNIFNSLRAGGLFFIRVPHLSSIHATGWEHFTMFGTGGVGSLTHGKNPNLPQFELISIGLAAGPIERFNGSRTITQKLIERILNLSFRLTDQFLASILGGVGEVQFLLRKPSQSREETGEVH